MSKLTDWIEHRTGARKGFRDFLNDQVPASTGWRNTLGSLLGALLLIQIVTGFLTALYYVPHPEAAFESLEWIKENVTAGGFVRSVHYWGTSFIMVALFFHVLRVFYSGAYRSPHEVSWLTGIALLVIVAGFAFTGQLLPYNQMGYWAATVGIEITSSIPFVGPAFADLLRGGETVGALTLTHFYALHVALLPMILGLLVTIHLYVLRRHGPVRSFFDTTTETESFFPKQFARDMIVITLGLSGLIFAAWWYQGPHVGPLDLADTTYIPRPEWYFSSHFELLRRTPGSLKIFATFVIPFVLFTAMTLLPWLDRAAGSSFRERRIVLAIGTFVLGSIAFLTIGDLTRERPVASEEQVTELKEDPVRAKLSKGRRIFRELKCQDCHIVNGRGRTVGPDLSGVGVQIQEAHLRKWLVNPQAFDPEAVMPPVETDADRLDALVFYLMSLDWEPEQLQ